MEIGDLMPAQLAVEGAAAPVVVNDLLPLAERAGELVLVGRGGERRAIARGQPVPWWTAVRGPDARAIQYLMPGEDALEHRHTQHAFRFVVEGEGVWTVVGRDLVPMRRGDFLPQAGGTGTHHNASSTPMAWIDGLDIPFQYASRGTVLRVRPRRDQG